MIRGLLLLAVAAVAQFDDMGFGGAPRSCPAFRCGAGKEPVPKRPMRLESTGCSNMGGGMQMFSAKEAEEDATRPCCDLRNACYGICGSTRASCDDAFEKCTTRTCAAIADDDASAACDSQAKMNNLMASLSDCKQFDAAQRRACDCVATDRAPARRGQSVADFYKAHDAAGVAKAAGLAAKADNARKLATLLAKLVAKFPAAVKKVADERSAWLEDLMKKGGDPGADAPHTTVEDGGADPPDDVVDLDDGGEL